MLSLSGKIGTVRLEACGAGDHVGRIENRVKTVKEQYRTVSQRLKYRLPRRMVSDCVFYVVKRLNAQPSGPGHICTFNWRKD